MRDRLSQSFEPCPICGFNSKWIRESDGSLKAIWDINCLRCGNFKIYERALIPLPEKLDQSISHILSSKIRSITHKDFRIDYDQLDDLVQVNELQSVDERANILLQELAKYFPEIGSGPNWRQINEILIKGKDLSQEDFSSPIAHLSCHLLSITYSKTWQELQYLLIDYLVSERRFINRSQSENLVISPAGWSRIDELKRQYVQSNIGFIAMKFEDSLIEYSRKWFEGAIKDAGYDAKVMYSHQHTKLIDNEMKALIRRSKFLVCDMTGNSRGAYYEAGFAHGLGIPVIFLCESDYFHKKENFLGPESQGVHFDTNHYTFIEWHPDKGEELKKELTAMIEAAIGSGLNKTK